MNKMAPFRQRWPNFNNLTAIYGESKPCTEERLSLSYPTFYANSDYVSAKL